MSAWSGNWSDPTTINNGNEYAGGDGIYFSDFNTIVNDFLYLKAAFDVLDPTNPRNYGRKDASNTWIDDNIFQPQEGCDFKIVNDDTYESVLEYNGWGSTLYLGGENGNVDVIVRSSISCAATPYSNSDLTNKGYVDTALSGKADLVDGKVPAAQLPSFVDDVVEYNSISDFPTVGESGKIYVAKDTNKTYRWSGTAYVEISESLALGETADTAYAGNKGKANAQAIALLQAQIQDCADRTASELEFMGDVQIDGALTNSDGNEYLNTADSATQSEMAEILAVLS